MKTTVEKRLKCYCHSGSAQQLIYYDDNWLNEDVIIRIDELSPFFKEVMVMVNWTGGNKKGSLKQGEKLTVPIPHNGGQYRIYA